MRRCLAWAVLALTLGGCGAPDRQLTIEFFDLSTDGLSTEPAAAGDGDVVVAEPGFDSEPLLVITEADIATWDTEGPALIHLVPGQKVSDLASAAVSAGELVFRLSINDDSVWGFITWYPTAPVPGFPYLMFPGGLGALLDHPEMLSYFELGSGGAVLAGADVLDAARAAWSD